MLEAGRPIAGQPFMLTISVKKLYPATCHAIELGDTCQSQTTVSQKDRNDNTAVA